NILLGWIVKSNCKTAEIIKYMEVVEYIAKRRFGDIDIHNKRIGQYFTLRNSIKADRITPFFGKTMKYNFIFIQRRSNGYFFSGFYGIDSFDIGEVLILGGFQCDFRTTCYLLLRDNVNLIRLAPCRNRLIGQLFFTGKKDSEGHQD